MYKTLHPYPTISESIQCLSISDLHAVIFNVNNLIKIIKVKREMDFLGCGTVAHFDAEYVLKWELYWYGLLFYRDFAKWCLPNLTSHQLPILKPYILFPDWIKNKGLHESTKQALLKRDYKYYQAYFN